MARSSKADFVLERKLGSGQFGTVYLGTRKLDGKPYAIKQLDMRQMSRREQEECVKEVEILAVLNSPYIIRYYDSFLEEGRLYIVTEYAAGGTLHNLVSRYGGPLAEELIWRISIQLMLGLHHMHSKRVLHRDIKSLNIFLDGPTTSGPATRVKIGDLGVSRFLSTKSNFAKTVIGTPYYLSPELCEEKPYNDKSDVWALGIVMYECCTGKHPFDGESQASLIMRILRGQYKPVVGYSAELVDLIKRCLTQAAARRPNTERLLGLTSVRSRARLYGIELPEAPTSIPIPLSTRKGDSALATSTMPSIAGKRKPPARSATRSSMAQLRAPVAASGAPTRRLPLRRPRSAGDNRDSPRESMSSKTPEVSPPKVKAQAAAISERPLSGQSGKLAALHKLRERRRQSHNGGWSPRDLPPEPANGACSGSGKLPSCQRPAGPQVRISEADEAGQAPGQENSETGLLVEEASSLSLQDSYDGSSAEAAADDQRIRELTQQQEAHRIRCQELIGMQAFDELYTLFKSEMDKDSPSGTGTLDSGRGDSADMMSEAVFRIIPPDKSEAVHLLYKLIYIESQLSRER
ncbi:hypothetical protein WJX72_006083 [[Myrmecia] bisecta]|uniref:non-specific serine/threonine protein kinase n=1 Tax=[Myrmecia] bisecta TaxID=41462 RepID=A0AAW1R7E9_9CHLO